MSALFVLFAMLLAAGMGLPSAPVQPASDVSQSSSTGAAQGGQRSAPIVSKQQTLVSEARDLSASASDDGKSKTFLAPADVRLPLPASDCAQETSGTADFVAVSTSSFDARAPPLES